VLFDHHQQLLDEPGITDPDLSPAAELVEGYLTLEPHGVAQRVASRFAAAAEANGHSRGRMPASCAPR
jgi:hypothetical protein